MYDKAYFMNLLLIVALSLVGIGLNIVVHYFLRLHHTRKINKEIEEIEYKRDILRSENDAMDQRRDFMLRLSMHYRMAKGQFKKIFNNDWVPYSLKLVDYLEGQEVDEDINIEIGTKSDRTQFDIEVVLHTIRYKLNGICSYRKIHEAISDLNKSLGDVHKGYKISEKRIREIVQMFKFNKDNEYRIITFVNHEIYDFYQDRLENAYPYELEQLNKSDNGLTYYFIIPATMRGGSGWVMVPIGEYLADKGRVSVVNGSLEPPKVLLSAVNGNLSADKS